MLGNGDEDGLMVRCGVNRGKAVYTCGETVCDVRGDYTVYGGTINTLEERESARVGRCSLVKCLELLNDEVRVANDVVLRVQLLRRRVVVRLSVDKVAVSGVSDKLSRTKD